MKRVDQKAATRALILRVATVQFNIHGYELVSLRDIAKAAKRTTGAIFASFACKEELWLEATGRPVPSEARCATLTYALRDLVAEVETYDIAELPKVSQLLIDARNALDHG